MLRIYKLGPHRLDYYLTITSGESDAPFVERDGYWRLPLESRPMPDDAVRREAFLTVMSGRDPETNVTLNRHQGRVQVCAYDATFAAPKSVSLLHVLGDASVATAIEKAHRQSVDSVMAFMDRKLIAVRGFGDGVRTSLHAVTLPQAVFEHRVSRALDPHLHSHVLVPNIARRADAQWNALDARPFYAHSGLLGALYRATLRHHLSREIGTRWRTVTPGWYDLDGLSTSMVNAFSRRRAEILRDADRVGVRTPRSLAVGAVRSREARNLDIAYSSLRSEWRDRAYRVGISPHRVDSVTGRSRRPASEPERDGGAVIAGISKRGECLSLSDVLRSVADGVSSGISVEAIEAAVTDAVAHQVMVPPSDLWPRGPRGYVGIPPASHTRTIEAGRFVSGMPMRDRLRERAPMREEALAFER